MGNFQPLNRTSQGGSNSVLFLDTDTGAPKLLEAANYRLGIARELAEALSMCQSVYGEGDYLGNVSAVFLLLIEDAMSLYDAATDSVNSQAEG